MSIARDEARETAKAVYVKAREPMSSLIEAYTTGRTAEPTDAEVRAAAIEMYHFEVPSHGEAITREQATKDFDVMWPSLHDRFMGEARAALQAARKAVTE